MKTCGRTRFGVVIGIRSQTSSVRRPSITLPWRPRKRSWKKPQKNRRKKNAATNRLPVDIEPPAPMRTRIKYTVLQTSLAARTRCLALLRTLRKHRSWGPINIGSSAIIRTECSTLAPPTSNRPTSEPSSSMKHGLCL